MVSLRGPCSLAVKVDADKFNIKGTRELRFASRVLKFCSLIAFLPYSQVVPLTANDVGTAFVVLFQVPVNPMPL